MMNRIKSLLRWARISGTTADDTDIPVQQSDYLGKVGDALIWLPYGYHASLPIDTLAIILAMSANADARVALPGSPRLRVQPIAVGENVVYHPGTGTKIHFKANGDIDIETKTPEGGTQGNINVIANDVNVTAAGDAAVVAVDATITSSGNVLVDCEGNVTVDSEATVTVDGATEVKVESAGAVNVLCDEVNLGESGGTFEKLLNATALASFNAHRHIVSGGVAAATIDPMVIDTDTTIETKAS